MHGKTVLVIDDDVELLRQMTAALMSAGFVVLPAADGAAGLRRIASSAVDLVITDILMPTQEGIETIMALRRDRPEVRILAVSGGLRLGPGEFLTLARMLGADETLAKPFRLGELVAIAQRLLGLEDSREIA